MGQAIDKAEVEWYTPKELAERWRLHPSTIHRMHRNKPEEFGRIMSGSLRIHRSQVEKIEELELHQATAKVVQSVRRAKTYGQVPEVDHFPDC